MTAKQILSDLAKMGSESTKKVLMKHGAREPFYGVKVADLKKIQKKVKKNHELALELYDSGVSDAMYLAGLIADPEKMTQKDLQKWAKDAYWYMLAEYTVAWVAAESKHGWDLAMKWIDSKDEKIASIGWSTLSSIVMITANEELDMKVLMQLFKRVKGDLQKSQNRVKYTMNGFIIATGSAVPDLTEVAKETASSIGVVQVDMGGTACKVPAAVEYIDKVIAKGYLGKKKKTAIC